LTNQEFGANILAMQIFVQKLNLLVTDVSNG